MNRIQKASADLPYQIFTEISNAGKNVQGSKRRVLWRYAFSSDKKEHQVELIHSVVSGKKVISLDGREILNNTSMMALEFSHGWVEDGRIFRVEVNPNVDSYDFQYVFSIDGVKFENMPTRATSTASSTVSSSSAADHNAGTRVNPKVPTVNIRNSPGGASGGRAAASNDTFDPFGEDNTPAPAPVVKSKSTSAPVHAPKPVVDLFDAPAPAPVSQQSHAFGGSSSQGFDSFGASDPFASRPAASDPFSSKSSGFGSDLFSSTPAIPKATNTGAFDPFGGSATNTKSYSTGGISNDLAGLKFDAPAPIKVEPVAEKPAPVVHDVPKKSASSELWDHGLVNLDIGGKTAPIKQPTITGPPIGTFVKTPDNKPVMMAPPSRPVVQPGMQPGLGYGAQPGLGYGAQAPMGYGMPQQPPQQGYGYNTTAPPLSGLQGGYPAQQQQQFPPQQQKPKDPFAFGGF